MLNITEREVYALSVAPCVYARRPSTTHCCDELLVTALAIAQSHSFVCGFQLMWQFDIGREKVEFWIIQKVADELIFSISARGSEECWTSNIIHAPLKPSHYANARIIQREFVDCVCQHTARMMYIVFLNWFLAIIACFECGEFAHLVVIICYKGNLKSRFCWFFLSELRYYYKSDV